MAEVLGRYSNLGDTGVKLIKAGVSARQNVRDEPWTPLTCGDVTSLRRMEPAEIHAMIVDYRSGIGSYRLAKIYGVSESTVLARLKAAGIDRTVARDQQAERVETTAAMHQLRAEGWTLRAIGEKYGLTRTAVGYRLRNTDHHTGNAELDRFDGVNQFQ